MVASMGAETALEVFMTPYTLCPATRATPSAADQEWAEPVELGFAAIGLRVSRA